MRDCPKKAYKAFQFTPLREGRQYAASWIEQLGGFSIHAPPRGATAEAFELYASFKIFSIHAPPRGATRNTESGANQGEKISIHAPPRGATLVWRRIWRRSIFQFTPLRRGDALISGVGHSAHHFNSRPSARGDHILSNVSHHVLHFNSRPSVRGDPQVLGGGCVLCISIHAPPRGATTIRCSTCRGTNFNSRPSARGDIEAANEVTSQTISIHAPPRGAT